MGQSCEDDPETNTNENTNVNENTNTNSNANENANTNVNENENVNINENTNVNENTNINENINVNENTNVNVNSNSNENTNNGLDTSHKEFNMNVRKWRFIPNKIEVDFGDEVKINLRSLDIEHNFTLSEYGIDETILPTETKVIEFTADQAGTFFFYSVGCGECESSVVGRLVVD